MAGALHFVAALFTPTKGQVMKKSRFFASAALAVCLMVPALSRAADAPVTGDVLGKLHQSNQKEIEMGKMAEKNGMSKDVKSFGKKLVKDHTAADKKVMALAKEEKIDLAAATPASGGDMADSPKGADFDTKFARDMLDDHKKDVDEATAARDATGDAKLKKLLTALIPTLQKHKDTAQKLVDGTK